MPLVRINNVGRVGIIEDTPAHELPPEAWSNGRNVRFVDGKVEKIEGEQAVFATPATPAHWLLPWESTAGYRWLYAGSTEVYYAAGGSNTNITRGTTVIGDNPYNAGPRPVWSGGILHGIPVINNDNGVDPPQSWDGVDRLEDLPNWPANTYCKVLRTYDQFLVALDVSTASGNFPYLVKWSHPAVPGTVPVTWDPADATKLAGEKSLSETPGVVVDCLPLRGQNIVYKTDSIWTMRLNNSQFVFAFDGASKAIGALNINCVVEFYGRHLIVGENDIVLFDGRTPQSIVNTRMRREFFGSLSGEFFNKTYVAVNYPKRECWICYVTQDSPNDYVNRALIWNWEENTWTVKDLPEIAFTSYGDIIEATGETFDDSSGQFDLDFGPFNAGGTSPANTQILHAKPLATSDFLQGDEGYTTSGTPYSVLLERTGLPISGVARDGSPKVDPASQKFIRAVFPKISAPSNVTVQISVGMQEQLGGPVLWEGPYDFTVGVDTRIDTCLQGRYFAFKLEDTSEFPWEMTGYDVDLELLGVN